MNVKQMCGMNAEMVDCMCERSCKNVYVSLKRG
jgi:hypothetical protein